MKNVIIIIVLIIAVGLVLYVKKKNAKSETAVVKTVESNLKIPKFLDLGADKCMACKAMEPVLKKLREKYQGELQVEFIDVWKNPKEAEKYNIKSIPTQIFFDADGKEISRHTGFISEEDILKVFEKQGELN